MRPQIFVASILGVTPWLPVNFQIVPFSLAVAAVVSGTATYTVEHTLDDVLNGQIPTGVFSQAGLTAQTTSKEGVYNTPITAVRLNVSAIAGSVSLTLLQGSTTG